VEFWLILLSEAPPNKRKAPGRTPSPPIENVLATALQKPRSGFNEQVNEQLFQKIGMLLRGFQSCASNISHIAMSVHHREYRTWDWHCAKRQSVQKG